WECRPTPSVPTPRICWPSWTRTRRWRRSRWRCGTACAPRPTNDVARHRLVERFTGDAVFLLSRRRRRPGGCSVLAFRRRRAPERAPAIVIGTGAAGRALACALRDGPYDLRPIGFLSTGAEPSTVAGLPVLGQA